MTTRITLFAGACVLLMATGAAAQGVIAGQTTEVRRIERPLIGSSQYITTSDGRTFKASQKSTSVLVATQLLQPEALVAMPEAGVVRGKSGIGAPVIAASVPRGVEPVPVIVIEGGRALDAGLTTNVFPGEVVAIGTVPPGTPIAVVGGAPIVREEGYYFRGTPSDTPRLLSIPLANGQWVTIEDRIERMPAMIDGGIQFDPAALVPGAYVRVVRRDDGTYFLGTASPPRETYNGVPAGKVGSVDAKAGVLELSDGSLVHPEHRASAVLRVGEQPIEASALRTGTWVVIDPSPRFTVEAPSAFPSDLMAAGRVMEVR